MKWINTTSPLLLRLGQWKKIANF